MVMLWNFPVFSRRAICQRGLLPVLILAVVLSARPAAAQGSFYVRDSFIAITNALLETHNPDVGIAGSWYRLLGQGLRIVQNALRPVANNTDELYGSNTSAGQAEYGIGMSVLFTTKQADPNCLTGFACTDHYGLLWGRGDVTSLNGYFARVTASGQVVILMNYKANTTLLASTVIKPPPYNVAHSMIFAIRNSVKEIYWDGVMVLSTTDNTLTGSSSTLLKNGLGARSTVAGGTVLDDFFISPFPTITGVSPTSGPPGGGQIMQVFGTNLGGCYARVAGTVAQGISGSLTNEIFYSPPHDAGVVTVDIATAYTFGNVKIPLYAPSLPNSYTYTPTLQSFRPHIFPLAGESPGSSGSVFRTTLQLNNPGDQPIMGKVVVHPAGAPFTSSDPGVAFMINPYATLSMPDLNGSMLAGGFGPADLVINTGASPVASMRYVKVDDTTAIGADVEEVFASVGLGEGQSGVLLAPPDAKAAGFSISVRTFIEDTTLRFDVRDAAGRPVGSATRSFSGNSFVMLSAAEILGVALAGGESITITPAAGFAMVYGVATDNVSLDLDLQRAARLDDPSSPPSKVILPLAASSHGSDGYFRTSAQLYNPTTSQMELRFAFLPEGSALVPCASPDCAASVVLAPGETRFIPDLVQFQNWVGVGSMDIETTGSGMPVMNFRAYRDSGASGNGGTAGALIGTVTETAALVAGDVGVLIAPPTAEGTRMDVGMRAFDDGASIEFTLLDSAGNFKEEAIRVYAPGSFRQLSTSELFSVPLGGSDSITIAVFSGSALVYGAAVDSGSGDTSYQLAQVAGPIPPLAITTASPLPPVALGAVYSQTLTANGGIPPYSNWTITSGLFFPGGLSLNSATGMISGAWTGGGLSPFNINGPFDFTVQVTDSAGTTASATLRIPVTSPMTITATSEALIGTVGVAFAQTFSVTGGVPPYSNWTVTDGSLPPGLSLNSTTGVVSGTPVGISGDFTFTIAVHDSSGATVSRSFVLTIQPPSLSTTLGRIGSFAQVASGSVWKTTMTLINLSAVTVNAQINLYADKGSPMTLPLTFPRFGFSTSASSVNLTLSPNESLVVESGAPTSSIGVGWADVQATETLSGYSTFRLSLPGVPDAQATVSLDSRLSSFLALPYDNTNSYQTGLALANQASATASITAILLDQNGVQLASSQITLPALGHASFFLNQQFSQSANQLGIIQFQSSGGITGVGLRFSPSGLFTSMPIIR